MATQAMFAAAPTRAGMYESFYLRLVNPREPVGAWIRHTVRKSPGQPPRGSVWCTVFDTRQGPPFMHKLSDQPLNVPADGWIAVGDSVIGDGHAQGSCGPASWSLRFACEQEELRHLSPAWLYRTPLPRTKLTSPAPHASFDGVIELAGREPLHVQEWIGMVGHNWGAQHAERWIWLHGLGFEQEPAAWLDVALARLKLGGRMTPWLASGALFFGGQRRRLGGLAARAAAVHEHGPQGCSLTLSGAGGLRVRVEVAVQAHTAAGWRYADPDGGEHDVINCSVAALELSVTPGARAGTVRMRSEHGGAYELGLRERDHGVPIAPFADR